MDRLMSALSRQKVKTDEEVQKVMIVYRASQAERAIKKAVELREAGRAVELLPERIGKDYEAYAKKNGIREILYTEEEGTL